MGLFFIIGSISFLSHFFLNVSNLFFTPFLSQEFIHLQECFFESSFIMAFLKVGIGLKFENKMSFNISGNFGS